MVQGIKTFSSHSSFIHAIAWQPDSDYHLATASIDKTLKLWDTRSAIPLSTLEGHTDQARLQNFCPLPNVVQPAAAHAQKKQ